MAVCDKITASISPDCNNELIAGVNDRIWIINYDDVSSLTRNSTYNEIIEAIVLNSGTNAYTYTGKNFSNQPQTTLVEEEYSSAFEHRIEYRIFADGDAVKRQLKEKKHGKFMVVVQNQFQGSNGDNAFTLYGGRNGLKLRECEQLKGNNPSLGSWRLVMSSNPKSLEPYPPNDVFITSFAATKAMLDALV